MCSSDLRVFRNAHRSLREQWLATEALGDRPYLIYEDEVITFADAHRIVNSVSAWLAANGVRKGDRVAIGMRNYPEFALAFWAVECIGAIVVSLNAWWVTEEMRYAFDDSGAMVAFVDGERLERLPSAMRAECGIRAVVVARGDAVDGAVPWAAGREWWSPRSAINHRRTGPGAPSEAVGREEPASGESGERGSSTVAMAPACPIRRRAPHRSHHGPHQGTVNI